MKTALRAALLLVGLLAIPIVPFVWLGESFEAALLQALREPSSPAVVSTWIVGLLAADLFLPVPSSAVITYAGGVLGLIPGMLVSWLGLSVGALGGFGLARVCGEAMARRFAESDDLARVQRFAQQHGTVALVLTRALPILAEACVLMLGASRLSWSAFLVPMLTSNFLLALTYAACGAYFQGTNAFPIAIVASGAVPLVAALVIRHVWRPRSGHVNEGP